MKNSKTDKKTDVITDTRDSSPPILKLDYALYQHYLDDSDLSESKKQEFLDTLWSMIVSFVDLGFEVHPLQQACEQKLDLSQLNLSDVLDSKDQLPHNIFSKVADHPKQGGAKRSES